MVGWETLLTRWQTSAAGSSTRTRATRFPAVDPARRAARGLGGGVAVEAEDGAFVFAPYGPEDAADDREREDLEKSVREKIARFVELEGQLAAKQAAIARLERFHREQAAARAAAGPNTGTNQENKKA